MISPAAAASSFASAADTCPPPPQVLDVSSAADDGRSPPSAESNFRELDDVFLQTQTRIWLGEVLQIRLNEQLNIADLLADGELLYEVSKEVRKMLSTKRMELRGVKAHKSERIFSRTSSGKYRPYSNVDSFLKICKILGMAGIDLFSPSDVVEKRDTRKVCICIRSFSKKARSIQLYVPDFDIVTYTVAMPTNMVGGIRRSWETSYRSPSSSASDGPYHKSSRQSRQHSNATSWRSYSCYSEESDDMDMIDSSTTYSYNSSSHVNAELLDSPEVSSMVVNYFERCSLQPDVQNQQENKHIRCWEAEDKSMMYFCSQHLDCGYQLEYGEPSQSFVDSDLQDGASVVGSEGYMQTRNLIDELEISYFIAHHTYSGDAYATRRNLENEFRSRASDVDDMEVSSIVSMNSVSGSVQGLNFNDQLDEKEYLENKWFSESPDNRIDLAIKKSSEASKYQEMVAAHETMEHELTNVNDGIRISRANSNAADDDDEFKEVQSNRSSFSVGFHQWDQKGKCGITIPQIGNNDRQSSTLSLSQVNSRKDTLHFIQKEATGDTDSKHFLDDGKHEKLQKLEVGNSDGTKDPSAGKSVHNKHMRLLVNSVVRGTAVLGALLLFLRLRNNVGEKTPKPDKQRDQRAKANNGNFSSQKVRMTGGVYPAEKLKFGE